MARRTEEIKLLLCSLIFLRNSTFSHRISILTCTVVMEYILSTVFHYKDVYSAVSEQRN